ncbi:proline-rich receptor-like protein kinase perk9 [Plakobranchus ocellatus]|uniref:Proline-rich receptor-like protein kinase perk9 n=1 Tax=Plakobranchus ocellatus TaxID=259542 RepID=A0AAV4AXC6_9GAST|nr:proline-rich receptor-like protein kinase perk9 [Plakobranchus ocellatus]
MAKTGENTAGKETADKKTAYQEKQNSQLARELGNMFLTQTLPLYKKLYGEVKLTDNPAGTEKEKLAADPLAPAAADTMMPDCFVCSQNEEDCHHSTLSLLLMKAFHLWFRFFLPLMFLRWSVDIALACTVLALALTKDFVRSGPVTTALKVLNSSVHTTERKASSEDQGETAATAEATRRRRSKTSAEDCFILSSVWDVVKYYFLAACSSFLHRLAGLDNEAEAQKSEDTLLKNQPRNGHPLTMAVHVSKKKWLADLVLNRMISKLMDYPVIGLFIEILGFNRQPNLLKKMQKIIKQNANLSELFGNTERQFMPLWISLMYHAYSLHVDFSVLAVGIPNGPPKLLAVVTDITRYLEGDITPYFNRDPLYDEDNDPDYEPEESSEDSLEYADDDELDTTRDDDRRGPGQGKKVDVDSPWFGSKGKENRVDAKQEQTTNEKEVWAIIIGLQGMQKAKPPKRSPQPLDKSDAPTSKDQAKRQRATKPKRKYKAKIKTKSPRLSTEAGARRLDKKLTDEHINCYKSSSREHEMQCKDFMASVTRLLNPMDANNTSVVMPVFMTKPEQQMEASSVSSPDTEHQDLSVQPPASVKATTSSPPNVEHQDLSVQPPARRSVEATTSSPPNVEHQDLSAQPPASVEATTSSPPNVEHQDLSVQPPARRSVEATTSSSPDVEHQDLSVQPPASVETTSSSPDAEQQGLSVQPPASVETTSSSPDTEQQDLSVQPPASGADSDAADAPVMEERADNLADKEGKQETEIKDQEEKHGQVEDEVDPDIAALLASGIQLETVSIRAAHEGAGACSASEVHTRAIFELDDDDYIYPDPADLPLPQSPAVSLSPSKRKRHPSWRVPRRCGWPGHQIVDTINEEDEPTGAGEETGNGNSDGTRSGKEVPQCTCDSYKPNEETVSHIVTEAEGQSKNHAPTTATKLSLFQKNYNKIRSMAEEVFRTTSSLHTDVEDEAKDKDHDQNISKGTLKHSSKKEKAQEKCVGQGNNQNHKSQAHDVKNEQEQAEVKAEVKMDKIKGKDQDQGKKKDNDQDKIKFRREKQDKYLAQNEIHKNEVNKEREKVQAEEEKFKEREASESTDVNTRLTATADQVLQKFKTMMPYMSQHNPIQFSPTPPSGVQKHPLVPFFVLRIARTEQLSKGSNQSNKSDSRDSRVVSSSSDEFLDALE